jgi:iron complex transport system ATP-binding protein
MDELALEARAISCGYGERLVLDRLSARIRKSEIVGVIGPNGSGKTTFLKAITKILPLKGGTVKFKGRDIAKLSYNELAKQVAVVSQLKENMFFSSTVQELVLWGRIPHFRSFQWLETKNDRGIVEEAMRLTDTLHLRRRQISELSGGEKQRTFIARALAQKPRLLLLDEPVAHLDINHRIGMFKLINRLSQRDDFTVISVLHDLNLASKYCQRVLLFSEGRVVAEGSPKDVITRDNIRNVYGAEVNIYQADAVEGPQILY